MGRVLVNFRFFVMPWDNAVKTIRKDASAVRSKIVHHGSFVSRSGVWYSGMCWSVYTQRCQGTVSQGKTSSGQGRKTYRCTRKPSSLALVEVNCCLFLLRSMPSVKG